MIAIPITLHMLAMLLVAYMEARQDARDIAKRYAIDHPSQWQERALASLMSAVLCAMLNAWGFGGHYWWPLLGMLVIGYGLFTPTFRYLLNRMRRPALPWDYVSLSNLYDAAFIAVAGDKAARLAYTTEGAAVLVGIYIATL